MSAGHLVDNIQAVRGRVGAACARAGRDPDSITLIAVSKKKPPADILAVAAAGVQHFGENRVEEAQDKIPQVMAAANAPITWHMIGHIQSRKAKFVPPIFNVIHSLDSVKLAEKLTEIANPQQPIYALMQVNISGEASKSGFNAFNWEHDRDVREKLWGQVTQLVALPNLQLRGLMTIAPFFEDASQIEETRPVFAGLARLRLALSESFGLPLPDLSMGMTDDYPIAIEEGATMIRVGRAIFGERA